MARILRKATDAPRRSLWQRFVDVAMTDVSALARAGQIQSNLEKLEEVLIEADFGVATSLRLVEDVERKSRRGTLRTEQDFRATLEDGVATALGADGDDTSIHFAAEKPTVILVIGVNGAGKTTFIGKLAALMAARGKRTLVGAADTFRAGAIDQLRTWAERADAEFVGSKAGADPASVAFDAVDAGVTRGSDVVIVDTAGRLHTSSGLMDELKKIHRVIGKRIPGAPHETLLVLDATIGQNAILQARTFAEAIPITGFVMTKLDGTAKGGIVLAVREEIGVPVKFIATGETMADIEPFNPIAFARELVEGSD
jgi:fused signal recognition particle receptor